MASLLFVVHGFQPSNLPEFREYLRNSANTTYLGTMQYVTNLVNLYHEG